MNKNRITLKPGEEVKIDVELLRAPHYDKGVTLDVLLRHLGQVYGNPLPPGVTMLDGKSKTLVGTGSAGHIVLKADATARGMHRRAGVRAGLRRDQLRREDRLRERSDLGEREEVKPTNGAQPCRSSVPMEDRGGRKRGVLLCCTDSASGWSFRARISITSRGNLTMRKPILIVAAVLVAGSLVNAAEEPVRLLTEKGVPKGWVVRQWNDVSKPAGDDTAWTVENGILKPGKKRGTWLLSEKEYADFIFEFEIKLTEVGNSGIALCAPMKGDPAFDGMELQFADLRYNPNAKENELTGSLYRASAPTKQVYKPTEWNTCKIELKGSKLKATINGELIQDIDLDKFDQKVKRLDNVTDAPALKDRPRKGHIGFQHLSRENQPIEIRNVKITELK